MVCESPETMRKLCLSTKFSHHEIRWNYSILSSVNTSEYLLPEELTTGYLQGEQKSHLMTLSRQKSYSLYPAGSVMFKFNNNNATILH